MLAERLTQSIGCDLISTVSAWMARFSVPDNTMPRNLLAH
jgi:hypothetical protein